MVTVPLGGPLQIEDGEWMFLDYVFPGPVAGLPTCPAIYCWFVDDVPKYVGQAQNLNQRIYGYVNPGPTQATNIKMKELLTSQQDAGSVVRLGVLSSISVNGNELADETLTEALGSKSLRVVLEGSVPPQLELDCSAVSLDNDERRNGHGQRAQVETAFHGT